MANDKLFAKLDSWFGNVEYTILHHWADAIGTSMTVYAVTRTDTELAFIRVFNIGGQVHVSVDKRTPIEDI